MEYATITSKYCCGIDLHARTMYLCVMDRAGTRVGMSGPKTRSPCWRLCIYLRPHRPVRGRDPGYHPTSCHPLFESSNTLHYIASQFQVQVIEG